MIPKPRRVITVDGVTYFWKATDPKYQSRYRRADDAFITPRVVVQKAPLPGGTVDRPMKCAFRAKRFTGGSVEDFWMYDDQSLRKVALTPKDIEALIREAHRQGWDGSRVFDLRGPFAVGGFVVDDRTEDNQDV